MMNIHMIILSLVVVALSGALGYHLDSSGKMKDPPLFWMMGVFTGFTSYFFAHWS